MKHTIEQLNAIIATIAASEQVTRVELGNFSRVVLEFVLESEDVRPINALLGKGENGKYILTSMNRRTANLFFKALIPFADNGAVELEQVVFTKKKAKAWDKYVKLITEFLADENNNIWTWSDENVNIEDKPKNYASKIQKLVSKALKDEVQGISQADLLQAVLDGGVDLNTILDLAVEQQQPLAA